jgi:hypothetical protein
VLFAVGILCGTQNQRKTTPTQSQKTVGESSLALNLGQGHPKIITATLALKITILYQEDSTRVTRGCPQF